MADGRVHNGQSVPQPGDREVRPHDDWPQGYWEVVGENLFHGVTVDGGYSSRCCPFVVRLVDVFVETRVVEQPEGEGRAKAREVATMQQYGRNQTISHRAENPHIPDCC